MPGKLECYFLVFSSHFYFSSNAFFSGIFFFFLIENSFSHWLTLIALVTPPSSPKMTIRVFLTVIVHIWALKINVIKNISASKCLSVGSFTLNKNTRIPQTYSFSNNGKNFQIIFKFKFNQIYFMQDVLTKNFFVLLFCYEAFNLILIYIKGALMQI